MNQISVLATLFIVIVTPCSSKPLITGPSYVVVQEGQNVSIECWSNKTVVLWYKFINITQNTKLIEEESVTSHFNLEMPEYVDWPDEIPEGRSEKYLAVMHLNNIRISDKGLYVCTYEKGDSEKIKTRIKKNRKHFFSMVSLNVTGLKPCLDVGESLVVSEGQNVNLTCKGARPVVWALLNNHTEVLQYTEDEVNDEGLYWSILEIKNANYSDVGFYICKFVNNSNRIYDDFDHKKEANVIFTYLFVKDRNHLLVPTQTLEINAQLSSKVIIPCKPTSPDVKVTLNPLGRENSHNPYFHYSYSKFIGATIISHIPYRDRLACIASLKNHSEKVIFNLHYYDPNLSSPVNITLDGMWQLNSFTENITTYDIVEGDDIMMTCSSRIVDKLAKIKWSVPPTHIERNYFSKRNYYGKEGIKKVLLISNVSIERSSGIYSCYVTNGLINSSIQSLQLHVVPKNSIYLELKPQIKEKIYLKEEDQYPDFIRWIIFFRAYPSLQLIWKVHDNSVLKFSWNMKKIDKINPMVKRNRKYEIQVKWSKGEIELRIYSPNYKDVGLHYLHAESLQPHLKSKLDIKIRKNATKNAKNIRRNISFRFLKEGKPEDVQIYLFPTNLLKIFGSQIHGNCSFYGYPQPKFKIYFSPCVLRNSCGTYKSFDIEKYQINEEVMTFKNYTSMPLSGRWTGLAKTPGYYFCSAQNKFGTKNSTKKPLYISDSEFLQAKFLQIEIKRNGEKYLSSEEEEFIEGDELDLNCRANLLIASLPLSWVKQSSNQSEILVGSRTIFIDTVVAVEERQSQFSYISTLRLNVTRKLNQQILVCKESSDNNLHSRIKMKVMKSMAPVWISRSLNGSLLKKKKNEHLTLMCKGGGKPAPITTWFKDGEKILPSNDDKRLTLNNEELSLAFLLRKDSGKYSCQIENRHGKLEDYIVLEVNDPEIVLQIYLIIIIGIVSSICFILGLTLMFKIIKNKRAEQILLYEIQKTFNEGKLDCLNPEMDLCQQAELLPYDKKFEVPRENIIIENLLGSGAFGNVFKATAFDLKPGQKKTVVAVKMVKSLDRFGHMKMLISELKIMIYIGCHKNIVNLLGACSKEMAIKGELLLIVEYCQHGNILEYMRRYRSNFIGQIRGKNTIHRADSQCNKFNGSNSSKFADKVAKTTTSRMIGLLNKENVGANEEIVECTAYTDMSSCSRLDSKNFPEENTLEKPLRTEDLLYWSYQIANGMMYLSERKVIHGDLAARNILLTEQNIVKISDFGLSRNIYKQENYRKTTKCPLPIKWMAIEALRDHVFSVQSDIWSFGVVLWEIFSMGESPYGGIEIDENFIFKLANGLRLKCPVYAPENLYKIMKLCWDEIPDKRPSFRNLKKLLNINLEEALKTSQILADEKTSVDSNVSEHLKLVIEPTYKLHSKEILTDKDEDGYEKNFYRFSRTSLIIDHDDFELNTFSESFELKQQMNDSQESYESENLLECSTNYLTMKPLLHNYDNDSILEQSNHIYSQLDQNYANISKNMNVLYTRINKSNRICKRGNKFKHMNCRNSSKKNSKVRNRSIRSETCDSSSGKYSYNKMLSLNVQPLQMNPVYFQTIK